VFISSNLILDFRLLPCSEYRMLSSGLFTGVCNTLYLLAYDDSGFGGLVVSMLASGTQDHGFAPGQSHQIFQGKKNPQHALLWKGSKAVCPMLQICGMLKNPIIYRGSRKF
jgi:hypothetical protein